MLNLTNYQARLMRGQLPERCEHVSGLCWWCHEAESRHLAVLGLVTITEKPHGIVTVDIAKRGERALRIYDAIKQSKGANHGR